jgi:hypothetical protein
MAPFFNWLDRIQIVEELMAKYLDAEMMDHLKGVFAVLETPPDL